MMGEDRPLVAVVTPVYNGEKYLAECLESVRVQSFQNWEYLVVDNASTDGTREIAEKFAAMDDRVRLHLYDEHVGVIQSHNRALHHISSRSKYCKVVSADDLLYPDCIARMVEVAEANPSVEFVGAYQLSGGEAGWDIKWAGLPYKKTVFSGRELCRQTLLGGRYLFGTPTSTLYRSDLVRSRNSFYPSLVPYADVMVYFEYLQNRDFGFVHQILSYERIHENTLSSSHKRIDKYASDMLRNLLKYGPVYLTRQEYESRLEVLLDNYYRVLAVGSLNFKDSEFWDYHKRTLRELGYPIYGKRFAKAMGAKLLDLLFNPKQTIERLLRRMN